MNPDFKAKWLIALRSGEYSQGKGYLRKGETFCCLGVACVVGNLDLDLVRDKETSWPTLNGENLWNDTELAHNTEFARLTGLTALEADDLAQMNDIGKSFEEIANYIEANL